MTREIGRKAGRGAALGALLLLVAGCQGSATVTPLPGVLTPGAGGEEQMVGAANKYLRLCMAHTNNGQESCACQASKLARYFGPTRFDRIVTVLARNPNAFRAKRNAPENHPALRREIGSQADVYSFTGAVQSCVYPLPDLVDKVISPN